MFKNIDDLKKEIEEFQKNIKKAKEITDDLYLKSEWIRANKEHLEALESNVTAKIESDSKANKEQLETLEANVTAKIESDSKANKEQLETLEANVTAKIESDSKANKEYLEELESNMHEAFNLNKDEMIAITERLDLEIKVQDKELKKLQNKTLEIEKQFQDKVLQIEEEHTKEKEKTLIWGIALTVGVVLALVLGIIF